MSDSKPLRIIPPRGLVSATGKAIGDFGMIRDGDRVLLGLSGGKDSLSLLHILLQLKDKAPIHFDLAAATVDPQAEDFDPSPLKDYVPQFGIPYFFESFPVVEQAKKSMDPGSSFCAFCSRMRRGMLYGAARREGYNVLALAQHLDDLAETFLMNACYGGKVRTMKANYVIQKGDLRVIRPLVYVRERRTAAFARNAGLPVISENCPACFSAPTERAHMKSVLAGLEQHNALVFPSLLTALKPLMAATIPPSYNSESTPSPSGPREP